ncbi:Phosphatidate cytidylyltransferase [Roseibacterium elongatum DSM 19469]|uniref:Phosphatidate cytidylyltransferase n=1 Tax=Roseicyclus elongatus DSM 19469 TaxID=1294273 RepID=W8RUT5_9RHOB|nr:Phosphatidate cytidylyltransferase [Roseibacterium elongatum DSM 19469]
MALSRDSFSDLLTRLLTGIVLAAVGLGAVWAGHPWFSLLVVAVVATLIWELARMLEAGAKRALILGALAGALLLAAKFLPVGLALPLLMLAGISGIAVLDRNRTLFVILTVLIMLASFGLMFHRDEFGVTWMLWLVLVVAVTDIFGYFAGRVFGGPKFWPRVSPKKTWSGTIAGWVGAGGIGAIFMAVTGAGLELIGVSVALSMASRWAISPSRLSSDVPASRTARRSCPAMAGCGTGSTVCWGRRWCCWWSKA